MIAFAVMIFITVSALGYVHIGFTKKSDKIFSHSNDIFHETLGGRRGGCVGDVPDKRGK